MSGHRCQYPRRSKTCAGRPPHALTAAARSAQAAGRRSASWGGRCAAVWLPALLLGRARFVLSVVRRFGCPRYYLPEHVCGWALCGGPVACAIAWPLTFGVELCAAVRLPALLLGRARFGLSVCDDTVACAITWPLTFCAKRRATTRLPAPLPWSRTFLVGRCTAIRLPAPLPWSRTFGAWRCTAVRLPAPLPWPRTFGAGPRTFGAGHCTVIRLPAPLSWPHTFEAGRCATIRLPAPLPWPRTFGAGRCATIRLFALPLTRARFGAERCVQRFGCPRYRLPAHAWGWALYRDSVARADTWLYTLSQTVLCAFHTRAPQFDLMPGKPAAPAQCARTAFRLSNAPPC